jgi:hypothetical protein
MLQPLGVATIDVAFEPQVNVTQLPSPEFSSVRKLALVEAQLLLVGPLP